MDLLQRIADPQNAQMNGLTAEAYHLSAEKLNEAINRAWNRLLSAWQTFQNHRDKLPAHDTGTTITRERWLLPLFNELGYGRLLAAKAMVIGEKNYPISHSWQHTPIHLVSFKLDLDHTSRDGNGVRRSSPHSLLQELLNRSDESLWGIVSNGLTLRILRNNISLTRQAYVEFDLEAMMNGEVYADFVLLWLLCHQSRVEAERPQDCWLEQWSKSAHEQGTRALDQLRVGVERAITELGSGFLAHPANGPLRERLRTGTLSAQDYYRQILRLVYRLLVFFVAEDREIIFDPDAPDLNRDLYTRYYSTARLRHLADQQIGTRHADLYQGLKLIMEKLGNEHGCPELGLPALNGFLFSREAIADLTDCQLANYALLAAIRWLAYTETGKTRRVVDYKNLGSEELGSVYESLLELHPIFFHLETGKFELATASGNERKTTGSYYTPTSLITSLLDSALDPVLEEAANKATIEEAEAAILNLKICDPACGSGHFLVAAAHRVAKRLAAVRTGDEEPAPEARRHALRDVVGRCIYGVDLNPMAVELCKVSLWMEAIEPGKPLSFLDAHIQCGNSLLGATPALLRQGIPDEAFEPIEGDDKKICSEFKKLNKQLRAGQNSLFREDQLDQMWEHQGTLTTSMIQLEQMSEETVRDIHSKEAFFAYLKESEAYQNALLWANTWCAAFVWKKTAEMRPPITHEEFNDIGKNPSALAPWRKAEIARLAKQYQFFHWHLAFPEVFRVPAADEDPKNEQVGWDGGFSVLLGNPPWEKIKLQEKEWFAARRPDIANAANTAQRKRMIEALAHEHTDLYAAFLDDLRTAAGESHLIRQSGRYPLCGRGDVNTYSIFAENMRQVLGAKGRMGCIVPSGIATDDTTKYFFRDIVETQTLASLYSFENEEFIFPAVHHATKFCLLTVAGAKMRQKAADFVFFARQTIDLQDEKKHFSLSVEDIKLLNPNTHTCPIFRSKRDMELTKAIYQRAPVLMKEGPVEENPWNIKFNSIFHMANDSHLFSTREQLEMAGWQLMGNIFQRGDEQYLPLYEGKMIWHFDHRFAHAGEPKGGTFLRGSSEYLSEEEHKDPRNLPLPRYWVHETHMLDYLRSRHKTFLAFRTVTASTNTRAIICSAIPVVPCGHSLVIGLIGREYAPETLFLSTSMSSLAFDYVARQKTGINLSLFILKQFPILLPESYINTCQWDKRGTLGDWILIRALELTYTAWDMEPFAKNCGYAGPPFRWDEERRFLLRCELDAAYFHLYGIARDDLDYIMETFPIVKRGDERLYDEYRTKRVILEIYDAMQQAIESGVAYETWLEPGPANPAVAHEPR